jgi:dehydrogenase/reductase SDR family protein 1
LAEAGAIVYVTGRSTGDAVTEWELGGTLELVVEEINKRGGEGRAIRCDHAVDNDVKAVFDTILLETGRLDILVNNAFQAPRLPSGEYDGDLLFKNYWEQPPWFWDALHTVGTRSHYTASYYSFDLMRRTKRQDPDSTPLIVHVSSFGGVSYSFNVAYGAGKAGVDKLARDMAVELRSEGVSCMAIYPGVVRTERMRDILSGDGWRNRTGLAAIDACIESPLLSGRVCAGLYRDAQTNGCARSGTVQVVAEVAKEMGIMDESGRTPPSIRSLKFLLPSVLLGRMRSYSPQLENLLVSLSPDILLPMSLMAGGPPQDTE